jgi:hypothetical protein
MTISTLDAPQVIVHSFDEPNNAIRVDGIGTAGAVTIEGTGPSGEVTVIVSNATGLDIVASYNIPYTSLTTSYFQVVASTAAAVSKIANYDTSGETIELALGGSGSEVVKMILGPGNDQYLDIDIPAGSRIAVRTVGSNASAGSLVLNLIG